MEVCPLNASREMVIDKADPPLTFICREGAPGR